MVLLEKDVNGKTFKTEFEFEDKHIRLVRDVLKCLEGKTVDVPNPSKKWEPPWESPKSLDDAILVYNRLQKYSIPKGYQWQKLTPSELGMIQIPILEWLPIVCKHVSFDSAYGSYFQGNKNLISHALDMWEIKDKILDYINFPPTEQAPADGLMTADFQKEYLKCTNPFTIFHYLDRRKDKITLARELKQSKDAFRFVLVHEIQHAINKLEIVYPALINWEGFIVNILTSDEGSLIDDFADSTILDDVLDKDTTNIEIETLESTFGHSIRTWYKGYKKFVDSMASLESVEKRMEMIKEKMNQLGYDKPKG